MSKVKQLEEREKELSDRLKGLRQRKDGIDQEKQAMIRQTALAEPAGDHGIEQGLGMVRSQDAATADLIQTTEAQLEIVRSEIEAARQEGRRDAAHARLDELYAKQDELGKRYIDGLFELLDARADWQENKLEIERLVNPFGRNPNLANQRREESGYSPRIVNQFMALPGVSGSTGPKHIRNIIKQLKGKLQGLQKQYADRPVGV